MVNCFMDQLIDCNLISIYPEVLAEGSHHYLKSKATWRAISPSPLLH